MLIFSSGMRVRGRLSSALARQAHTCLPTLAAVTLIAILSQVTATAMPASSASRKQQAGEQFEKAEQMREALSGRRAEERTRKDYRRVADAYRRVYYLAPGSSKAGASVLAVAEILAEMGRQFEPGEKELRAAIGQYEFLRREYPGSKYRFEALFTIGQIYKEDLRDEDAARQTFEEFLKHYPHNHLAPQARQALAELKEPKPDLQPVQETGADKTEAAMAETVAAKKPAVLPMVTGIRHWSTPDYTRVAIDVDNEVKYEAGRVPDPDRIFFDLPNTRLASVLVGKTFDVEDGFLKKIRVAQYQPGYTRVVLEVADVSDYSAFLLPNPYRLIIDIHSRQPRSRTLVAKASPGGGVDDEAGGVTAVEKEKSYRSVEKANQAGQTISASGGRKPGATADQVAENRSSQASHATGGRRASSRNPPRKIIVSDDDDDESADAGSTANARPAKTADRSRPRTGGSAPSASQRDTAAPGRSNSNSRTTITAAQPKPANPLFSDSDDTGGPELKATANPTTAPTAIAVAPRSKQQRRSTKSTAAAVPATREAAPTLAGDRSLIRALGLKIGRIVVDAGHGGHDTGTIGPHGLMEKDVVLDVALRLGRLLESRLGADVIYTRDDDTFIPLETRTAIANEHQADLFISVHANSSSDPSARGIETYYLNFTSSPDALEVAARENAISEKSIFELQDLVKKITLKDKIEESRELATDIQQSLYAGLASRRSTLRNRGVKKAPFVVLIGANMPSILAEISFVSNPTDEAKLRTAAYRQKVAESLYKGIAKYAGGLSGIKIASSMNKDAGQ